MAIKGQIEGMDNQAAAGEDRDTKMQARRSKRVRAFMHDYEQLCRHHSMTIVSDDDLDVQEMTPSDLDKHFADISETMDETDGKVPPPSHNV